MMNFDEARKLREDADRTFVIGGETFTYRAAVAPEAIIHWNNAVSGKAELDETGWIAMFDETTLAMLDPGQEEKWANVRRPDAPHPLNIDDMRAVMNFLVENATGRPTGEPSGSSNGSEKTETALRDVSSPPAVASTA